MQSKCGDKGVLYWNARMLEIYNIASQIVLCSRESVICDDYFINIVLREDLSSSREESSAIVHLIK